MKERVLYNHPESSFQPEGWYNCLDAKDMSDKSTDGVSFDGSDSEGVTSDESD